MGIFFEPNSMNACCLCGSTENLTGEHKIKAAALRSEFGSDQMTIGVEGASEDELRLAQGPKSKEFHFKSRMCGECNNTTTQPADREFERFNREARSFYDNGEDPAQVFHLAQYAPDTSEFLNVHRYFAKLMSCHMADVAAPRSRLMTLFARGFTNVNCIELRVDEDITFKRASPLGLRQYAAHGGLAIYGNKETGGANGFHSTLTIGPIRYVFCSRLNMFEQMALAFAHPVFHQWCKEKVEAAKEMPIPHTDQVRLGLIEET